MGVVVYLPGVGPVDLAARRVHEAVNRYDERLIFDRNLQTGEWAVWIKMEHGKPPYQIMSFGRDVPDPDYVLRRLYMADAWRHGEKILDEMNRHNDALLRSEESKWQDVVGETAEVVESYLHRQRLTPYFRSLRKRDPKQRGN